jgi:hypothetical protein
MWKTLKRGRVISLKGQVWAHETSLTLSLYIAPNQECIQVSAYYSFSPTRSISGAVKNATLRQKGWFQFSHCEFYIYMKQHSSSVCIKPDIKHIILYTDANTLTITTSSPQNWISITVLRRWYFTVHCDIWEG